MNETAPLFSVHRAQVTGISTTAGTCSVAFELGGNSITLPHVLIAGSTVSGVHWMPNVGDFVLIGYEPGQQPQVLAAYLDPSAQNNVTPALAAGEVRLGSSVTTRGQTIVGAQSTITGSAPPAATHYMQITLDGGATYWKVPLS